MRESFFRAVIWLADELYIFAGVKERPSNLVEDYDYRYAEAR